MKLVMTLLARDEADIVDAQLAFHLNAGVDFVIATDNASTDGTTEILQRYERAGHLHLIHEPGRATRQAEWVTRMARLAASDFRADWVLHSDADEFWWPRGGSLKEVLATVPERYGVVRGCWRHFLPTADDGSFFTERMIVRLARPFFPGDKTTIFHAHQKIAHRATVDATVETGNHEVLGSGLEPIRAWHPIEVLHFSIRTVAQLERKAGGGWLRNEAHEPTQHLLLFHEAAREHRLPEYFESFVLGDDALGRALAEGTVAIDTRLRDALRALRTEDGGFSLPGAPGEATHLTFPRPEVADEAAYAGEASVLVEIDGIVRAESRVDALEERLETLERGLLSRLRRLAPR